MANSRDKTIERDRSEKSKKSAMKADMVFLFIVGLTIGFILSTLYSESLTSESKPHELISIDDYSTIGISNRSPSVVRKVRILCFLLTAPKYHHTRAVHVYNLWGKHCDKLIFASTLTDVNIGALAFNVSDDHSHLWGKVKLMLLHIDKNFINDYDWFYKGDDDSYAILENMRYMLSAYSPEDPIYFGHKFNTSAHKMGYFSGGSGYVMSRRAVRLFAEKILKNASLCQVNDDGGSEDWNASVCFDTVGVYPGDGRDLAKRERFLPFTPEGHLFAHPGHWWYWDRKYYITDEGLDCCSNYSVAYHYINPNHMYQLYYLTYRLRAYGNIYRHPLPPKKLNFTRIAYILDQQRLNNTFYNGVVANKK